MLGAEWILLPVENFQRKFPRLVVFVKNGVLEEWSWFLPNIGHGAPDWICPRQNTSFSGRNIIISIRRFAIHAIILISYKFCSVLLSKNLTTNYCHSRMLLIIYTTNLKKTTKYYLKTVQSSLNGYFTTPYQCDTRNIHAIPIH